jgi:hypothetical protein
MVSMGALRDEMMRGLPHSATATPHALKCSPSRHFSHTQLLAALYLSVSLPCGPAMDPRVGEAAVASPGGVDSTRPFARRVRA